MLSNVPNLFFTGTYFHYAYTGRVDLTFTWVCRVLNLMKERGCQICLVKRDRNVPEVDPSLYPSSGYIQRGLAAGTYPKVPDFGTAWEGASDPYIEGYSLRKGKLEDGVLHLSKL